MVVGICDLISGMVVGYRCIFESLSQGNDRCSLRVTVETAFTASVAEEVFLPNTLLCIFAPLHI